MKGLSMSGSIKDDASEITIGMQKQVENEMSSISLEEMFDDDSLTAEEYGFMIGYIQAG